MPESPAVRSRTNRHVQEFRQLDRSAALRRRRGLRLAEGIKVIEAACTAGARFERVLLSSRLESDPRGQQLGVALRTTATPIIRLADGIMDYIYGGDGHQGIVAILNRSGPRLDDVIAPAAGPLALIGLGLQDPGNVGALVRIADAVGAAGVIVSRGGADPYGRRAVRASMGSLFRVPVVDDVDAEELIDRLQSSGRQMLAADPHARTTLWEIEWPDRCAVLLGSEGRGLPAAVPASGLTRFRIPMRDGVESLNVAAAAALISFEAMRRRAAG